MKFQEGIDGNEIGYFEVDIKPNLRSINRNGGKPASEMSLTNNNNLGIGQVQLKLILIIGTSSV